MKHAVAKQAANEMVLREVDKVFFDQRISIAVVTISSEEGEIRHMAWRLLCTKHFCEGDVFSFSTRTGDLKRRKGKSARVPY